MFLLHHPHSCVYCNEFWLWRRYRTVFNVIIHFNYFVSGILKKKNNVSQLRLIRTSYWHTSEHYWKFYLFEEDYFILLLWKCAHNIDLKGNHKRSKRCKNKSWNHCQFHGNDNSLNAPSLLNNLLAFVFKNRYIFHKRN